MRICLISSSFFPAMSYGGPISSTWGLSNKLSEKGVQVYVSTTNANGKERLQDVETNKHAKISDNLWIRYYHEEIINTFSFSFLFNVWKDIKRSNIIYVQYLFNYTVIISLFYAFLLRRKVIMCARGSFSHMTFTRKKILKHLWILLCIRPFYKIINWHASSFLEKQDIIRFFPNANVTILPDGVDTDSFNIPTLGLSNKELIKKYTGKDFDVVDDVIFSMGRLHYIKRFDILIDAFSIFLIQNQNAKLMIAGEDDGCKDDIVDQISLLNLEDSVFLIGEVNHAEKTEILKNCTVFSLCSSFESFGIVIIEALACGCPVVVSNKTAWIDIEKNKCGIFVNNTKEDFCLAFNNIKSQDINAKRCQDYVRNNFDWEVVSAKFMELIKNNI